MDLNRDKYCLLLDLPITPVNLKACIQGQYLAEEVKDDFTLANGSKMTGTK